MYTEAALNAGDRRWGIVGASLRSPAVRDALKPQDGLYTLAVRGADGERLQVIGAIKDVLVAPENPEALLARALPIPAVDDRHADGDREGLLLRSGHRGARRDASRHRARPCRSRAAAHARRDFWSRRCGAGVRRRCLPFTVLCCDNLPHNGRTVAGDRDAVRARCAIRRSPASSATRSRFPRRWSIASRRRRPMTTAPRSRRGSASRTPRPSSPSRSANGSSRTASRAGRAGLVDCRRRIRHRRRAVREHEAAAAQRQPFDAWPISAISPATRPSPTP